MDDSKIKERIGRLGFIVDCRRAAGDVVDVLLELGEQVDAVDETLLLREGDVRGTIGYILVDGRLSVRRSGREPVSVAAPALIGEMQQFSISGSRSASVLTEGRCALLKFDWPAFYGALEGKLRPLDFQAVKEAIRRHSAANHSFD